MKILSGTACAKELKEELKLECEQLTKVQLPKPKLVAVLVICFNESFQRKV